MCIRDSRPYCNPPQSAIRPEEHATSLQAFEPGTARAQERPRTLSPTLARGVFCGTFREESESDDESGA
eukprot:463232-Alexandrium_andersonii.AAC.1